MRRYIATLKQYGICPATLTADMNGHICSYTCEDHEKSKSDKSETSLLFEIERSATLVALCVLGPAEFNCFRKNKHGVSMQETVAQAAEKFRKCGGSGAVLDTKIIQIVGESGCRSHDFSLLYKIMISPSYCPAHATN